MSSTAVVVAITRLPHAADLPLPAYASAQGAGLDLPAAVDAPLSIAPNARVRVPTGIAIALPPGYEAQVRPRSGLAFEYGVTVLNAPGTIDADYRGEVFILLANLGERVFTVTRGMRVAQLVVAPVVRVAWRATGALPATARGGGGFGSTGLVGEA